MKLSASHSKFIRPAITAALVFVIALTIHTQIRAAGVLDPTFGTNGRTIAVVGSAAAAKATVIQPDGKIVVAGDVARDNTGRDIVLVRFNPNGTLDANFGDGGRVYTAVSNLDEAANAVALQPDGKIVVVGSVQPFAEFASGDFLVVRYNPNGSLDSTFGTNGVVKVNQSTTDVFNAVALQPDGKIVAAGTTSQNYNDYAVIRFNTNGTLDASFANSGLFFLDNGGFFLRDEILRAVALFPNGRILLGGTNRDAVSGSEVLILLESNGALATDFGNNGIKFEGAGMDGPGQTHNLAILPDGRFLTISRSSFRRYLGNGSPDPTFPAIFPGDNGFVTNIGTDFAVRSDGRIIVLNQRSGSSIPFTTVYDPNGHRINRVRNLSGIDIAVQPDNKFVIVNSTADNFSATRFLSITSPATRLADLDYDETTDFIVTRANGSVYALRSSQNVASYRIDDNNGGRRVIPEDYGSQLGSLRLFYWQTYSPTNTPAYFRGVNETGNTVSYQWGAYEDIPVGGNYDGDSRFDLSTFRTITDFAVFRPSNGTWYVLTNPGNQFRAVQFGQAGDKPVPADYDYDGFTDFAVFRPSNGVWYVLRSFDNQFQAVQFGQNGDIPLTGDFDGDGRADLTVYRPSNGTWYSLQTTAGFRVVQFGISTDQPVPGDYDADGKHDFAVYRGGTWYILGSARGFYAVQWGSQDDSPVAVRYDY